MINCRIAICTRAAKGEPYYGIEGSGQGQEREKRKKGLKKAKQQAE